MSLPREVDEPVLSVTDLMVELDTPSGVLRAVNGVNFEIWPGETVALVGESGCGKTMSALAVLGLLPKPGRVAGGRIGFGGRELLGLPTRELRKIRGSQISMIFQEPTSSLNPVFTIGQQITDVLRAHDRGLSRRAARTRAVDLLESVGIPDAASRVDEYPHQWSGGMCQRAMIAMAMANRPRLLIADEPTTALDVTTQAQVLEVLQAAKRETSAATLLITHDLGLVAEMADRVVVMYAGSVVETAGLDELFGAPRHPYTLGLMTSLPRLDGEVRRLLPIPGQPPQLHNVPQGCSFHPRCRLRRGRMRCAEVVPPLAGVGASRRLSACHFVDEMAGEVATASRELGVAL
jgi:oligopeptide/dipeptide ABC transporter ATP-binding protein